MASYWALIGKALIRRLTPGCRSIHYGFEGEISRYRTNFGHPLKLRRFWLFKPFRFVSHSRNFVSHFQQEDLFLRRNGRQRKEIILRRYGTFFSSGSFFFGLRGISTFRQMLPL